MHQLYGGSFNAKVYNVIYNVISLMYQLKILSHCSHNKCKQIYGQILSQLHKC